MAEYQTIRSRTVGVDQARIDEGLRAHMNKVYATMSGGMLITAAAAWAIANLAVTSDPTGATVALREGQYLTGLGEMLYTTPLRWVVMFAPLAFLLFGWGALMRRGSAAAVSFGFFAFAAVMGVSMSSIFLVFTDVSIIQTFLVTAIAFAGLSLWGYTTKRDLTGMGTFLMMGVFGLLGDGPQHLPCDVSM
jgi:FtsH-binding integral membrane protein